MAYLLRDRDSPGIYCRESTEPNAAPDLASWSTQPEIGLEGRKLRCTVHGVPFR